MKRFFSRVARHIWPRWLLLGALLGVLGLIGWFGLLAWRERQPEALWQRARAALAQKDFERARIELHNIVQKTPTDAAAHLELANIYRQRATGRNVEAYAGEPRWLVHLATAAELRPNDAALQRELMRALADMGRRFEAAVAAERLIQIDPVDSEARYWLAWRAVARHKHQQAQQHLDALFESAAQPSFRGLALEAKLAEDLHDQQRLARVVDRAIAAANDLDAMQLANLGNQESQALQGLLALAGDVLVHDAPQAAPPADAQRHAQRHSSPDRKATQRIGGVLTILERLAANGEPHALRNAADLATKLAHQYMASRIHDFVAGSESAAVSFFVPRDESNKIGRPPWLARVETLLQQALDAEAASPEATARLAAVWIGLGQTDRAVDLLQRVCAGEGISTSTETDDQDAFAVALLPHRKLLAEQFLLQGRWQQCRGQAQQLLEYPQTAADGHFLIGHVELAAGHLDRALHHFLEAARDRGETLPLRVALAYTYLVLGQWREALPHIVALRSAAEASHVQPAQTTPESIIWSKAFQLDVASLRRTEAYVRLALGQWDEALPLLQALRNTRYNIDAVSMAFRFLWTQGHRKQALKQLTAARTKFPDSADLLRLHATALALLGQADAADRLVREFVSQHRDDLEAQLFAARWAIARRQYDDALGRLEWLRRNKPECHAASVLLAQLTLAQGRPERALEVARSIPPESRWAPAATLVAIDALIEQGALQAADELCQQLSDTSWAKLARGRIALESQNPTAAIEAFAESLEFTPVRGLARSGLLQAVAQQAQQQGTRNAKQLVEQLLQEHPRDAGLLLLSARLALHEHQPQTALERVQQIETLRGTSPGLQLLKARALESLGHLEDALAAVRRALQIDARSLPAHLTAARLALRLKQWPAALNHSKAALALAPQNATALQMLVESQHRLGDDRAAEQTLSHWIEQQPKTPLPYRLLVRFYARRGQLDQAEKVAEQGLELHPTDAELLGEHVRLLLRQNRWAEAAQRARRAYQASPGFELAITLASAFYDARDLSAAEHWAHLAIEQANDEQRFAAHWLQGNVQLGLYRQTGDRRRAEHARRWYELALAQRPTHLQAGNNLAWLLLEALDDSAAALRVAEQVRAGRPASQLPPAFIDTLATIYRRCGRLKDAARLLREAVEATGGDPLVVYQLGLLYLAEEQPQRAKAALRRALRDGLDGRAADEARRRLSQLESAESRG